ncbi:MAG TPA: ribosome small subunit-dependent GTPase A [Verrucomicrobiales bacterium]|nr:ribosome small subunit-dependent GTPase A [Verrucomicrobiales bacterium]
MDLRDLGWNDALDVGFAPFRDRGLEAALVTADFGGGLCVLTACGAEDPAVLSGRLKHQAASAAELPTVGDWVAIRRDSNSPPGHPARIEHRLPRRSCFCRKAPGKETAQQMVAANVDFVLLVTDVDVDLRPGRIERYLLLAQEGGAAPVVLLNKADLLPASEVAQRLSSLKSVTGQAPSHAISALQRSGLEALHPYCRPGIVSALVGSSGVGKSTLLNALLERPLQDTAAVNAHTGKGRHTTTARRALLLPQGGLLIDNPGMRELHIWSDKDALRESFADIEALAAQCRFPNCRHRSDAGCRVRAALDEGLLERRRYDNFLRLAEEISAVNQRRR